MDSHVSLTVKDVEKPSYYSRGKLSFLHSKWSKYNLYLLPMDENHLPQEPN